MRSRAVLLALLWSALVFVALLTRPLLPIDETRYLSVAWEMWQRGDFLVPYLNGVPYSHKPPLLFWLIHAGWWLWGVNEWWPRLIHPLAGALALWLTLHLGRRLWPREPRRAAMAPWLLLSTAAWLIFLTVVQFDLLLVVCTLLAMIGLLSAADGSRRGWVEVALAVGLGGLVKGPVILIHVLPVALAAPLWAQSAGRWGWWYLGLLLAVSLGVGVTLAWALPAGWSGGEAYRNAIFWGQTAGRVRNSFAHAQPWWWYGLVLPLGLLPWSLWPRLWRSLAHRRLLSEPAVRFLLAWALPVVLVLTLVSGKQVKYLLPVFPALALLAARGLVNADRSEVLERPWLAGLCLLIPGLLVLILPLAVRLGLSEWLGKVSPGWGLALIGLGILIMVLPRQSLDRLVPGTAVAAMLALVVLHLGLSGPSARAYDLSEVACRIAGYQTAGRPVLNVGKYHGQYHFLGRLRQPLAEEMSQAALDWSADHPDGYVIVYEKQWAGVPEGAEYAQPYRGGSLSIWRAPAAFAHWGPTVEQGAP